MNDNQQTRRLQILLTEDEWALLTEVTERKGFRTWSDTVRCLIRQEAQKE